MRRPVALALTAILLVPAARLSAEEKLDAYLEWRSGSELIVDGQRLVVPAGAKFKGRGRAFSPASIPLGYEIRATGERQKDGSIAVSELDARPNGQAWLEADVQRVTDELEARCDRLGRFVQEDQDGHSESLGRLIQSGPQVDRVRRIVDRLVPPYLNPGDVRVYVIENDEWNAFAMGNFSIYVYSGLLRDMDDDELAIVLGHELVHATHEHTRRQLARQTKQGLGVLGALFLSQGIGNDTARGAAQIVTQGIALALSSGYGRDLEDQADRVGLRYAYEGGFDVRKAPALWMRFAAKYHDPNKVVNFFFGDHSLSEARAKNLERELALNYPDGPKADHVHAERTARTPAHGGASPMRSALAPGPGLGLGAPGPAAGPSPVGRDSRYAVPDTTGTTRIEVGMSESEVRERLGEPRRQLRQGARVRWEYPELSVVFARGRVVEVQF